MEWASITASEGLQRLKRGGLALDVRSSLEFGQGAIPGFSNIPILNNEHRHLVGLTYKEQGQDEAIALGLRLVSPLRKDLLRQWKGSLNRAAEDERLLICWRGGLRSRIAAEWLAQVNFGGTRISGGYKALRAELLLGLTSPPDFIVLAGLTGAGKTDMLHALARSRVVDLEGYANHRGSSFGLQLAATQPTQQTFENALGLALFQSPTEMVIEAESRMVGNCAVPNLIKSAMDASPRVVLECSQEARNRRIFREYVEAPLVRHSPDEVQRHLSLALERIGKRLGGMRAQGIKKLLDDAFLKSEINFEAHTPWIESLLSEYYDPQYEHSNRVNQRPILFSGDFASVKDFFVDRFDRRGA